MVFGSNYPFGGMGLGGLWGHFLSFFSSFFSLKKIVPKIIFLARFGYFLRICSKFRQEFGVILGLLASFLCKRRFLENLVFP